MPTENRSSNTEMVSVPREPLRQFIEYSASVCKSPAWVKYKAALLTALEQPAPQPHPEPIAWMVGTAIWLTKEEAERDAAETGLPIIPFGPLTGSAEIEQLREVIKHSDAQIMRQSMRISNQRAQLAERDALLAEIAKRHWSGVDFDLPADLATRIKALSASAEPSAAVSFQSRVQPWLMECFGEMIAGDREERNHRFIEEALELVQALGATADEAHQLVDYVFGRAVGEPAQEVGGVMVTLAALCLANGLDMHQLAETELARIWTKVEQIRAKQASKPQFGPLPGVYPERKQ
ncbi:MULTISPECIES: hypothetical protein [Pseudomonas]|uniref:hypothetical protein n=1 Tax=Pseudomonas TaxID=286 RepID=UPI0019D2BC67|nr:MULTISPECIES: hypothetical protein [Pseudomonas]MCE0912015.1 hypothetical protein [Pseudomonas kurunegalensis]WJR57551.1 hypothetical protein LU664_008340 [Pseudomonas kurunegalensis]